MTDPQARELGALVRRARLEKGLSLLAFTELTGLDYSWLNRLERGLYSAPNPVHLARVAEALDIDPARIDEVSANHLAASLPSVRTYFRSKTKATPEQLDAIEAVLREIHDHPRATWPNGDDDRTGAVR
jgi:transcriptional regulator with XRE-family HTH domain